MNCIETTGLSYTYSGQRSIVEDISLAVPDKSIYGFLGPNGAGKTTTLRLLLGLLKKQKGEIRLFNQSFEKNRVHILKNIGSMIESPSLYSQLSAAENLEIWRQLYQCPQKRIGEVLETVGLSDTGKKQAGHFSLGMKQRLGIAIALLHRPSLLILDEPTNGLDPNGIIAIRTLLTTLNREQKMTIVISSHLLAEIERIATHVGIIHHGSMLFQGTLDDLHSKQLANAMTVLETNDPDRTADLLLADGFAVTRQDGQIVLPTVENKKIAMLVRQLVEEGIDVYQVIRVQHDLESIFIDLIK